MEPALRTGLEAVVGHLQRDGLDAHLGSNCAYVGVGDAALVVPLCQVESPPGGCLHSAALGVALRLREDQPALFQDLVTHLGSSPGEAVVQALLLWRHGNLPPLLPLIGGPMLPEVARFDRDSELYCPPWTIYSGPYQIAGPQQEELTERLGACPPLSVLRELLQQEIDPRRMHWIKLYRCRDEDLDEADCYLDGVQFAPGVSRLLEWEWPCGEGLHFFRQFLVLLPEGRDPAELIAERLRMRRAVCQAVDQFRAHPAADLDVIIDGLVADGVEEALADQLTDFVPLAYGRVVLAAMGIRVADTYICMQADGRPSRPRKLSEEPVYADALAMAHCEAETGLDEDTLQAIGRWSAELCTVNEAVNQGLDLDDVHGSEMLPPVFGATEYPRELLPPRKRKRWWQFWLENHR